MTSPFYSRRHLCLGPAALTLCAALVGCGSTNSRTATEQLLTSDAVDMAIAQIDLRPLASQKVYFDTTYLTNYKGIGFVNAEYIISSVRQQLVGAGCLLQENKDEADYIVEGRIGALGTDSHDIVYGIPASNALSTAASAFSGTPLIPAIPEISLARKNDQKSAAKIALFAYERESKQRVWQSGMAVARSTARDTWLLGAGPFQSGTVYDGVKFAGSDLKTLAQPLDVAVDDNESAVLTDLREPIVFRLPRRNKEPEAKVQTAGAQDEAADDGVVAASAEAEAPAELETSGELAPAETDQSPGGG